MNAQNLLNEILPILHSIKDDTEKLQKVLAFLSDEIYEDPKEPDLPGKYQKVVSEIAGNIDAGLVCFLNLDTLEIEDVPKNFLFDPEEFEAMTGETYESLNMKNEEWEHCLTFEPLESHESFKIMSEFTDSLENEKFQNRLVNALNNRKPFANFKYIIDNSEHRSDWFDFKKKYLENHVKELILMELNREDY